MLSKERESSEVQQKTKLEEKLEAAMQRKAELQAKSDKKKEIAEARRQRARELSQTVYEEYIQAATSCYQRVILDLGTELAVKEKEQEVRLSILEEQMRYLGEKEEKRELQAHLNDIILAIKTNFVTVVFPALCSWGLYVNNVALELIERIMGNEYVQTFLVLIGTWAVLPLVFIESRVWGLILR